jgi:DNA-binding NtrC family response regulator
MTSKRIDDTPTEATTDDDRPKPRRLVAMWSGGSLTRVLPAGGRLLIGRGSEADVQVEDASVSRRHAYLVIDDALAVEDLGGTNGTRVDGRKIERGATAPVRPGALIELGKVLLIVQDGREDKTPDAKATGIVVADPAMARVHQLVAMVAKSTLSVILLGETGVGKEVLATLVHRSSSRATKPFLKVNCAALVETLLEAELFGYERGAFTGAQQAKAGLLETSDGGTLFLDEIGEMPLPTQAKLLRVLESGEVTRVGGVKPRKLDVRFVSATNRDLRELSASGQFRKDLFFRLDGASIRIPPLRERRGEITRLATTFLEEACRDNGRVPMRFAPEAGAALLAHPWPGNVRELRNVVARAAILTEGDVIGAGDLRFEALGGDGGPLELPSAGTSAGEEEEERRRIADALEQCVGNQTRAAKLLGISRGTLLKRLNALNFPRPRRKDEE